MTFTYLGLLALFAGIGAFIGMFWNDMGSFMRILTTAGLGIGFLNITIVMQRRNRWQDFLPGAYLISLFFITSGLFVTLRELSNGDDVVAACIFVFGAMLSLTMCLLAVLRQPVLVFAALVFLNGLMAALCQKADLSIQADGLALGAMNLVIAYGLHAKLYPRLGVLCDLAGIGLLYIVAWDLLESHGGLDLLLVGIGALVMWIGVRESHRLKLFMGAAQIFCAVVYYTKEYFANDHSWPLFLILLGGLFIWFGNFTRKLMDRIA